MTRVLVADDDATLLELMRELLEMLGYSVTTVVSAGEVLERLRADRSDVLLQDVRMPGLDLAAQMRAIRADPELRSLAVIFLSAAMNVADLARQLGADGVVEKPFDPEALRERIDECIRRRR